MYRCFTEDAKSAQVFCSQQHTINIGKGLDTFMKKFIFGKYTTSWTYFHFS